MICSLFPVLQHPKESLAKVMWQYYDDIQSVMSHNPVHIANNLYTNSFITKHIHQKVTDPTTFITNDDKAHELAQACIKLITSHKDPERMLREFLEIIEKYPISANVTEAIREVSI